MNFKPIGVVHSPFKNKDEIDVERHLIPDGFADVCGKLEIFDDFIEGLQDLTGFSHLLVVFGFHRSQEKSLYAHPPYDHKKRGVFATRSPNRPNPIGITIVELLRVEGPVLDVRGMDMLEGTPILDIKPYTPKDLKPNARFGWLDKIKK